MIVPSVFFIASKYIKTITYPLLIWIVLLLFSLLGVNFLAVLELAKQKEIVFNQDGLFGEIFVETYKSLEENLN